MQATTAVRATPINCYDCHNELRWSVRDTSVGIVGYCQCCESDYYFHDAEGRTLPHLPQRSKPTKTMWLLPLALIGYATYLIC